MYTIKFFFGTAIRSLITIFGFTIAFNFLAQEFPSGYRHFAAVGRAISEPLSYTVIALVLYLCVKHGVLSLWKVVPKPAPPPAKGGGKKKGK